MIVATIDLDNAANINVDEIDDVWELNAIGEAILAKFEDTAQGDPWGWDWPTMRVTHPDLCGLWDRCLVRVKQIRSEQRTNKAIRLANNGEMLPE